jgi:hypothetical protein
MESLVLCPTGWRMIKDLCKGDLVIGSSGKAVGVTGTYPQGVRETFWVEFCDGCGVEVSDFHLWLIYEGPTDILPSTVSTLELLHRAKVLHDQHGEFGTRLGRIPVVRPVHYEPRTLAFDPYTLGVLLPSFDPSASGPLSITCHPLDLKHYLQQLRPRADLSHSPSSHGMVELFVGEPLTTFLSHYLTGDTGILRIPSDMRMASVSQRVAFVQGLLDASPSTDCEVLCGTDVLARDIAEIVLSIGGLAFKSSKKCVLTLRLPEDIAPYLSPTKQEASSKDLRVSPLRFIKKISPLRKTEVMCISVAASDRLYVTENVSHELPTDRLSDLLLSVHRDTQHHPVDRPSPLQSTKQRSCSALGLGQVATSCDSVPTLFLSVGQMLTTMWNSTASLEGRR